MLDVKPWPCSFTQHERRYYGLFATRPPGLTKGFILAINLESETTCKALHIFSLKLWVSILRNLPPVSYHTTHNFLSNGIGFEHNIFSFESVSLNKCKSELFGGVPDFPLEI